MKDPFHNHMGENAAASSKEDVLYLTLDIWSSINSPVNPCIYERYKEEKEVDVCRVFEWKFMSYHYLWEGLQLSIRYGYELGRVSNTAFPSLLSRDFHISSICDEMKRAWLFSSVRSTEMNLFFR